MFRVLLRLYLITIVTFSAAIYLIPKLVVQVFEHRYLAYNVEQSRGMQTLIVKQYQRAPVERWSQVTSSNGSMPGSVKKRGNSSPAPVRSSETGWAPLALSAGLVFS